MVFAPSEGKAGLAYGSSIPVSGLVSAEKSQAFVWVSLKRCLRLQNCVTEIICAQKRQERIVLATQR